MLPTNETTCKNDNSDSNSYLTEKDIAGQLNVSVKTLQRWRGTGEGPTYIKAGARVLYDIKDITSWLDARKVQSTSAYVGA